MKSLFRLVDAVKYDAREHVNHDFSLSLCFSWFESWLKIGIAFQRFRKSNPLNFRNCLVFCIQTSFNQFQISFSTTLEKRVGDLNCLVHVGFCDLNSRGCHLLSILQLGCWKNLGRDFFQFKSVWVVFLFYVLDPQFYFTWMRRDGLGGCVLTFMLTSWEITGHFVSWGMDDGIEAFHQICLPLFTYMLAS